MTSPDPLPQILLDLARIVESMARSAEEESALLQELVSAHKTYVAAVRALLTGSPIPPEPNPGDGGEIAIGQQAAVDVVGGLGKNIADLSGALADRGKARAGELSSVQKKEQEEKKGKPTGGTGGGAQVGGGGTDVASAGGGGATGGTSSGPPAGPPSAPTGGGDGTGGTQSGAGGPQTGGTQRGTGVGSGATRRPDGGDKQPTSGNGASSTGKDKTPQQPTTPAPPGASSIGTGAMDIP